MIARLHSVAFHGIEAVPVEVEVDVARRGFAGTAVVGLPDTAVKESIERVRSAMQNSGYQFPRYKTVVNLPAAELRRASSIFEPATGVGLIIANGNVVVDRTDDYAWPANWLWTSGCPQSEVPCRPQFWPKPAASAYDRDLAEVCGQEHVKRALTIAAAAGCRRWEPAQPSRVLSAPRRQSSDA